MLDPSSLLLSLATTAIAPVWDQWLKKRLQHPNTVLPHNPELSDHLRQACHQYTQKHAELSSPIAQAFCRLLTEDCFQGLIMQWIDATSSGEQQNKKEAILECLSNSLIPCFSDESQRNENAAILVSQFLQSLERLPSFREWRTYILAEKNNQGIEALRQGKAPVCPEAECNRVLDLYRTHLLKTCDIIDLQNLPEQDTQLATQQLLLRKLYIPVRLVPYKKETETDSRNQTDDDDMEEEDQASVPVGSYLDSNLRLVVLGDPGSGKTTMMRWLITAFLLRFKDDGDYTSLPDIDSLPHTPYLPVLIRCREIGDEDLNRDFSEILLQQLKKTTLKPDDVDILHRVLLHEMDTGNVLLLIDGLDEVPSLQTRYRFYEQLQATTERYPRLASIMTSRIVGYRDINRYIHTTFQNTKIADLTPEDKEQFARRWVEVTCNHLPEDDRKQYLADLLEALQSNHRINLLTNSPLLLTTLALIKRKIGRLPNNRNELYQEAVTVLLNWNPQCHDPLDKKEALPQLGFVAYAMCRRGIQRISEDELLTLLETLRRKYPSIRHIDNRSCKEFLTNLEERSSLLIQVGLNQDEPVWEFRHLTFQEYLAAQSLIDFANKHSSVK